MQREKDLTFFMALRMAFSFDSNASNARVLADLTTLTDSSESAIDEARMI